MASTISRRLPPSIGASSTPRSSASTNIPTAQQGSASLPPYEPLSHPLSEASQHKLHELPRTHPLGPFRQHQRQAIVSIIAAMGDLTELKSDRRRERQRARTKGREDPEACVTRDEATEIYAEEVDELNDKLEHGMRRLIDTQTGLDTAEIVLRELDANVSTGAGIVAPTQSTLGASQARNRMIDRTQDEDDDDEDGDFASTQPTTSAPVGVTPSQLRQDKIAQRQQEYSSLSLSEKYASHNDYVEFKKVLHEASHPGDDAPPLPRPSTWFADEAHTKDVKNEATGRDRVKGKAKTGRGTTRTTSVDESDEDIQIAAERKSIRCPLTLQPMKEPISSTKCPHSFERSAIFEMLAASELRLPTHPPSQSQASQNPMRRQENALECPECRTVLRADDLRPDAALMRRIQRIERQRKEQDDDDDEGEGDSRLPHSTQMKRVVDLGRQSVQKRVKAENLARRTPSRGGVVQHTMQDSMQDSEEEDEIEVDEDGVPTTQMGNGEVEDDDEEGVQETQVG